MCGLHLSALEQVSTSGSPLRVGVSANKGKHTNELLLGLVCAFEDLVNLDAGLPPIEFIWRDDGRNPQCAASVAADYCMMGVQYVIGHLSASASLSASKIYQDNEVCFLAPGTSHPELTHHASTSLFRLCGKDDAQGEFIDQFANRLAANAVTTIIAQNNAYGLMLSESVPSHNVESTLSIVVPENDCARIEVEQLEIIRARSFASSGQTIILCGVHEITGQLVRQLREAGINDTIIVGDDALIHDFTVICGEYTENVYVVGLAAAESKKYDQLRADLQRRYISRIGVSPGAYFETSYWSAYILLSTLAEQQEETRCAEVAVDIRSKVWATSLGDLSFDGHGDAQGLAWSLYTIEESTFVPVPGAGQY